jgi:hypothetical protein
VLEHKYIAHQSHDEGVLGYEKESAPNRCLKAVRSGGMANETQPLCGLMFSVDFVENKHNPKWG